MKTKEELENIKEEIENLNTELRELSDEELAEVTGGRAIKEKLTYVKDIMPVIFAKLAFGGGAKLTLPGEYDEQIIDKD